MRLLSSSAVHALGLLRQAQEYRSINSSDLSSFVWGIAKAANNPRKLLDYGGNDEVEENNAVFFDWNDEGMPASEFAAGDIFPPELAECGFDVTKILGSVQNFDPYEVSPDILEVFSDDGEVDCTEEQEAEFIGAVDSFSLCTGWHKFVEDKEALDKLAEDVEKECGAFVPASPLEVDQVNFNDMDDCLDVVLGENPLGDFLRDFYQNPGRNCECATAFGEAVPSCLIHSLDAEVIVPGSLFKKASCLVGKACEAIEGICLEELTGLDGCLPPLDGKKSCYKIELDCALEGSMSLVLPPKLTVGELPDTCKAVNEEDFTGKNIPGRLSTAYRKCAADDNDSGEEQVVDEDEDSATSEMLGFKDVSEDEKETSKEGESVGVVSASYVSEPSLEEYKNEMHENGKFEEPAAKKMSWAVFGFGLAFTVGMVVVAFLVAKVVQANGRDDSDPSKNDFTQIPAIHCDGVEEMLVPRPVV